MTSHGYTALTKIAITIMSLIINVLIGSTLSVLTLLQAILVLHWNKYFSFILAILVAVGVQWYLYALPKIRAYLNNGDHQ